jgi:hypothetical protein
MDSERAKKVRKRKCKQVIGNDLQGATSQSKKS